MLEVHVTKAVWNHPFTRPSPDEQQSISAVAYSVCTVSSPHTSPPVFDDLWKEGPSGKGLGFISLVGWF